MANIAQLEEILQSIEENESVTNALIVSRSGMHIAGSVPGGVHTETFVAMTAIMLGAADTATSELKEMLDNVIVTLERSRIFLRTISSRGILVIRTDLERPFEDIIDIINNSIKKIETSL